MSVLTTTCQLGLRILYAVLGLSLSTVVAAHSISSIEVSRPEGMRNYLLALPDTLPAGKHPLVILLHGHSGSAQQLLGQERTAAPLSVWLSIADRDGLLIAAPNGAKGSDGRQGWHDCRADASENPQSDDVGFIQAIISREIAEHNADPNRIFVMGMSNGGIMAFRLAQELSSKLAGIAAISASMAADSNCTAIRSQLSVLIIAGTSDPLVPYAGGDVHFVSSATRGTVIGAEQSAEHWRVGDTLPATPSSVSTFAHQGTDNTSAEKTVWGSNPYGLQVELIRVVKGGHIEPSISQRYRWLYTRIVGMQNGDLETAEEAWHFFKDKKAYRK